MKVLLANNKSLDSLNIDTLLKTENEFKKSKKELSGKQQLLFEHLKKFYANKTNLDKLLNIIDPTRNSELSLRLIECFAVNYSNEYNTIYNLNTYKQKSINKENKDKGKSLKRNKTISNSYDDHFKVYNSYKSQLNEVSKANFDTFCRGMKINYHYDENNSIITTVGQLNFFKWAIENNILGYIEENMKEIEYDMNFSTKNNKREDDNDICRENDKNYTKKKTDIIQATCEKKNTVKKNLKRNKSNKKDSKKDIEDKEKNSEKNSEKEKNMKNKEKLDKTKKNVVINKKKTTQRKKRKELSESASKSIIKYHYPITIEFD